MSVTAPTRHIGETIRRAREERGWRQNAFAERVGTSPANVNKWEQGTHEPTVGSLFRIALALEMSIERLCEGINPTYDATRQQSPALDQIATLWHDVGPADQEYILKLVRRFALEPPPRGDD